MREKSATCWLSRFNEEPNGRLALFCFPYAGGTAANFRPWYDALRGSIQLAGVQLPGRRERLSEPPFRHLPDLIQAVGPALLPFFNTPFAFFGHSMGALIAFELAYWLRRTENPMPIHLFVSGRRAPHLPNSEARIYDLPEPEFIEQLRQLNGTPEEVLNHPELMQLMIPLLRADFSVCETYQYQRDAPLNCPITVFSGLEDPGVPRDRLEAWRVHTTSTFSFHLFPGGHFFIHTAQRDILRLITENLARTRHKHAEA
jgi:medium-chain acyl-[acyl-carrier-protein] hydrolase